MRADEAYLETAVLLGFLDPERAKQIREEWRLRDDLSLRELLLDRGYLDASADKAILEALRAKETPGVETDFDLESDSAISRAARPTVASDPGDPTVTLDAVPPARPDWMEEEGRRPDSGPVAIPQLRPSPGPVPGPGSTGAAPVPRPRSPKAAPRPSPGFPNAACVPGPAPAKAARRAGPAPLPVADEATETFDTARAAGAAVQVSGPDLLFAGVGAKYEFGGSIGRGGMGEVMLATDRFLRRDVAVKTLIAAEKPGARAKFLQEARITGRLEHPNIVPVHEIGTDSDGRPYMAMKRIKGRSLRDILRSLAEGGPSGLDLEEDLSTAGASGINRAATRTRRRAPGRPGSERRDHAGEDRALATNRLLEVFKKVCQAVAYAHNQGIIHRDIKPANIMVGEFGEVQLMDWGIARKLGQPEREAVEGEPDSLPESADELRTAYGVVKGTPAYMAPEQARGEGDRIDRRSDIYALGGVLYSILTLLPPVEKASAPEVLGRVSRGEIVPPSRRAPDRDIPRELEAIVAKAMHLDPEARYPSALELEADVDAWLHGRMIGAARYAVWHVLARWAKRNKRAMAGMALGALAGLGTLSFGVYATISAIHRSRVEELDQAVENQRRTFEAERRAREEERKRERQGRVRAAGERYAEATRAFEEARDVPFNPGDPEPWFQARLPALLELAQACQSHPETPPPWREELARESDEVQARAEAAGAWALAEHVAQAAVLWGAIDAAEGAIRAQRARGEREAALEQDRSRLENVLSRIREAEGR